MKTMVAFLEMLAHLVTDECVKDMGHIWLYHFWADCFVSVECILGWFLPLFFLLYASALLYWLHLMVPSGKLPVQVLTHLRSCLIG